MAGRVKRVVGNAREGWSSNPEREYERQRQETMNRQWEQEYAKRAQQYNRQFSEPAMRNQSKPVIKKEQPTQKIQKLQKIESTQTKQSKQETQRKNTRVQQNLKNRKTGR